jgi:hypothetical protein
MRSALRLRCAHASIYTNLRSLQDVAEAFQLRRLTVFVDDQLR